MERKDRKKKKLESCFVVTSNVDGHFLKVGFKSDQVSQIHGCVKFWQCGGTPFPPKTSFQLFEKGPCCDKLYNPPTDYIIDYNTRRVQFTSPPKCKFCDSGIARPNVYLFGDGKSFVENNDIIRKTEYDQWISKVKDELKRNSKLRFSIIEIGCGLRVPSIRKRCEEVFDACPSQQTEFIRINPEYPDNKILRSPSISIKDTCLSALQKIDHHL